jgi:hypothetical protein
MEKFMLIFHSGTSTPQGSPEEMQEYMNKWFAWIEQLSKEGKYAAGEALLPGGKLITGKSKTVTDGPYTEGKEIVGGYFIVNADNYDEAVEIAKGCPDFAYDGSVQVRQVMKFDM